MAFDPTTATPEVVEKPAFDPSTAQPISGDTTVRRAGGLPEPIRSATEFMSQRDEGIDYYRGVDSALLRAGFSRMSNDAEKENFLTRQVGMGNYGKDNFGAWYIKPQGLKVLGINSEIPVSLDEQRMTKYDLMDWAGDIPALIGGAGAGLAATGVGALPGMGAVALGAAAGKAYDEIIKVFQGYNKKGPGEMAATLAGEGAAAAAGEGLVRAGGKALNWYSKGNSPGRQGLVQDALDIGARPKSWQAIDSGGALLKRFQATAERIIGDPAQTINREALLGFSDRILGKAGVPLDNIGEQLIKKPAETAVKLSAAATQAKTQADNSLRFSLQNIQRMLGSKDLDVGAKVSAEIVKARQGFGEKSSILYSEVDNLLGGQPVVPTASLKAQAEKIAKQLPRTEDGKVIFTSGNEANPIADILNLPDQITLAQAQRIRTSLRESATVTDLVPGVDKHDVGMLKGAAEGMFDDAANSLGYGVKSTVLGPDGKPLTTVKMLPPGQTKQAIDLLRAADSFYKDGIKKFDAPAIAAITRDASSYGYVEPDRILDYVIKPGYTAAAARVKGLVPEGTWSKVARSHFDSLIEQSTVLREGGDLIDGRRLYNKISDMGKTLDVVYGKDAPAIRKYASELAARDGHIDPATLTGDVADALKTAVQKQTQLDDFMKNNYLAALAKPGQEAEQAVEFIFRPKSATRINEAKKFYGETSPEFQGLQNAAMKNLLGNLVERTDDPLIKTLSGTALRKELDRYGRETLTATFGKDLTADLYKFSDIAELVTKKGPMGAGGIVAASVALHPLSNLGKIAETVLLTKFLRTPGAIKWLSEGIHPNTPPKQAAAALARVSAVATALVGDETGSASVTVTGPEE